MFFGSLKAVDAREHETRRARDARFGVVEQTRRETRQLLAGVHDSRFADDEIVGRASKGCAAAQSRSLLAFGKGYVEARDGIDADAAGFKKTGGKDVPDL